MRVRARVGRGTVARAPASGVLREAREARWLLGPEVTERSSGIGQRWGRVVIGRCPGGAGRGAGARAGVPVEACAEGRDLHHGLG